MRNYKTQMEAAKKGIVTPEMETVAKKENMDVNELMALVAAGQVAIPANETILHSLPRVSVKALKLR